MIDVARHAGVALKTVSRVVNSEPGVSPDMAARVQRAIAQLGYRHNASASSLRRVDQASSSIGIVLEDVSNPFSSTLHRAIEDVARERGYLVLAGSSDEDPARERELVDNFSMRSVDGLIIVPAGNDQEYLHRETREGTPIVLVDRTSTSLDGVDSVVSDNLGGAAAGVRHLIARGHRRLLFLGDLVEIQTAAQRLDGFRNACVESGLDMAQQSVVTELRTIEAAEQAVLEVMTRSPRPTAIFASQNLVTIGAVRALRRLELQDCIAIVGFDDFPLADLLSPAITVVAQDPAALGRRSAELILRRISGDDGPAERITLSTTLIERGSGEIAPSQ